MDLVSILIRECERWERGRECLRRVVEVAVTVCGDVPVAEGCHPCGLDGGGVEARQVESCRRINMVSGF